MLFQTMDEKSECVGIYCSGELYFDEEDFPTVLSKTWKYTEHLKEREGIEYASLYLSGKKVEDVLPDYLLEEWEDVTKKLQSFNRSLSLSMVSLAENCIYDLTPKRFLLQWGEVKNRITQYVLQNMPKPRRYEYLLSLCKLLTKISNQPLKINRRLLGSYLPSDPLLKRVSPGSSYIQYNQFGTRTGRLTTRPGSFPILTLKKSSRSIVEPNNSSFVELDFNGAEVRVMMGILGMKQPQFDVHQYHHEKVFKNKTTRQEIKAAFFAWLYGSKTEETKRHSKMLEKFYTTSQILDQYWDGRTAYTPYRKVITGVDKHHALNYIIQSTAAELTLLQALKINKYLETYGSGSFIAAIIHDAIIIDMCDNDRIHLDNIKKIMRSTKFGDFAVNIHEGESLGTMTRSHADDEKY